MLVRGGWAGCCAETWYYQGIKAIKSINQSINQHIFSDYKNKFYNDIIKN